VPRRLIDVRLRALAARDRCDVCVSTCVFGQPMPCPGLPLAGFVSDVNPTLPERIRANIGNWVEQADITFTISDFTASEVHKFKPAFADRIHSIPLAPPPGPGQCVPGLPGCFFYPAAPNPHKNHLPLLEAALGLAERGLEFRLTLTGAGMNQFPWPTGGGEVIERMRAFLAVHREVIGGRVVVAGDAKPEDIARHLAEASCVVLPSAYEGYGLPLIEALAQGKRVICAEIAPFREQVARHGCEALVTFTPVGDAAALEAAMAAHLGRAREPAFSDDAIRERMGRWTWENAARRCRSLLETLIRHG
jgi:glycosyltransferase involved in cell wall biosynthesis